MALDPRTDSLKFDCTPRIPLKSLQVEDGYKDYEMLQEPRYHVHLEREKMPGQDSRQRSQDDEDRANQSHVAFCQYGDRVLTLSGVKEIEQQISECRARIPNIGNQPHGLLAENLQLPARERSTGKADARLMEPEIFAPVYQQIARIATMPMYPHVPPRTIA